MVVKCKSECTKILKYQICALDLALLMQAKAHAAVYKVNQITILTRQRKPFTAIFT